MVEGLRRARLEVIGLGLAGFVDGAIKAGEWLEGEIGDGSVPSGSMARGVLRFLSGSVGVRLAETVTAGGGLATDILMEALCVAIAFSMS